VAPSDPAEAFSQLPCRRSRSLQAALSLTGRSGGYHPALLAKAQQDLTATTDGRGECAHDIDRSDQRCSDRRAKARARAGVQSRCGSWCVRWAARPEAGAARGPALAGGGARGAGPAAPSAGNNPPFPNGATTWQQAAISLGWGYGSLNPGSIQADSGANNQLRQGIIGSSTKVRRARSTTGARSARGRGARAA
jgi:hypothetical protein